MFAHDCNSTRPRPEIKMVETQTPNGKVKVDESLWGSWKNENDRNRNNHCFLDDEFFFCKKEEDI